MPSPHPASVSPYGERTTNVLKSDCPSADDLGCLDTSSNNFTLDFCNIRGLRSNFQSVETQLSSTKLHLLLLTETKLSVTTDSSPFSVPSYFLHPRFLINLGRNSYTHLLDSMVVSTLMPRRRTETEPRHTSADCGWSIKINGCTQTLPFDLE